MLEVTHTGKDHGNSVFIAFFDGVFVPDGASGLYDSGDSRFVGSLYAVVKGEERVGCENRTFCLLSRVSDGEVEGCYR